MMADNAERHVATRWKPTIDFEEGGIHIGEPYTEAAVAAN